MEISAKIVADSRREGTRLLSFYVTHPRFILAEVNTHRDLSRNSASSRAIPIERRIQQIKDHPFVPLAFAANKRGMQAGEALDERDNSKAQDAWLRLRDAAVEGVQGLLDAGIHKQWGNRPLEPYAWHSAILSGTEWDNFFNLRTHHKAQPEFIELAEKMREAMRASTPRDLKVGDWHLPFISEEELGDNITTDDLIKVSVGRCAAVSYDRALDLRNLEEWIALHDVLLPAGHMSPFEHQAVVLPHSKSPPFSPIYRVGADAWTWVVDHYKCGNFRAPFLQYRKTLPNEAVWQGEQ